MYQEFIEPEKTNNNPKSKYKSKIFYIVLIFFGILISALLFVTLLGRSQIFSKSSLSSKNPTTSSTITKSQSPEADSNFQSNQTVNGNIIFSQSFGSVQNSSEELFSINPAEKTISQLTEKYDKNAIIEFPRFSFDGERIVFKHKNKIYIRSLRGKDDFKVIFESKNNMNICCPSFNPEGNRIYFHLEMAKYIE